MLVVGVRLLPAQASSHRLYGNIIKVQTDPTHHQRPLVGVAEGETTSSAFSIGSGSLVTSTLIPSGLEKADLRTAAPP